MESHSSCSQGQHTQESKISRGESLFPGGMHLGRALGGQTTQLQGLQKQEHDGTLGPTFPAPLVSAAQAAGDDRQPRRTLRCGTRCIPWASVAARETGTQRSGSHWELGD